MTKEQEELLKECLTILKEVDREIWKCTQFLVDGPGENVFAGTHGLKTNIPLLIKRLEIMEESEIKDTITSFVVERVEGIKNIQEVEENCGSLWITLKNGDVYFVMVDKCDPDAKGVRKEIR